MDVEDYAEAIEAMRQSVAARYGVAPVELRPPATPERIAAAGAQLGFALPDDVATMLQAADGGSLFGHGITFAPVHPFTPDSDQDEIPLVTATSGARQLIWPHRNFGGEIEYLPGRDFISLAPNGQHGVWYEVSGPNAGSILYYDVMAIDWHVAKVAPSLESLFLAARECTEAYGEFIIADETDHIYRRHDIDTRMNG